VGGKFLEIHGKKSPIRLGRFFASEHGAQKHQHAENQQHDAPDQVDVDAEGMAVHFDVGTGGRAIDQTSSAPTSENMRPIGQRISSPIIYFLSTKNDVKNDAADQQNAAQHRRPPETAWSPSASLGVNE
jgi:hypothetical protein